MTLSIWIGKSIHGLSVGASINDSSIEISSYGIEAFKDGRQTLCLLSPSTRRKNRALMALPCSVEADASDLECFKSEATYEQGDCSWVSWREGELDPESY